MGRSTTLLLSNYPIEDLRPTTGLFRQENRIDYPWVESRQGLQSGTDSLPATNLIRAVLRLDCVHASTDERNAERFVQQHVSPNERSESASKRPRIERGILLGGPKTTQTVFIFSKIENSHIETPVALAGKDHCLPDRIGIAAQDDGLAERLTLTNSRGEPLLGWVLPC